MSRILFESLQLPVLQNRVYDSREEALACPRGDVRLIQDSRTGIVTNSSFDPARVVYDERYDNEQANSERFREHLSSVADLVSEVLGTEELVEVGCGKGHFLEMLAARGCDISGFDPTYEGSNPRIARSLFAPGVAVAGQGLILRHVLEHIPNPVGFLQNLAAANDGKGLIYIEVPCFDWIMRHRAWFDIFYEHVNYFRLTDFRRIFSRIERVGHCFGGQYIYVVAELGSLRESLGEDFDKVDFPADFARSLHEPSRACVWGAASKGVIFSLLRERAGAPVSMVVDVNPAKQGKYLPGTGLKVHSPEEVSALLPRDSVVYVMNSNYLDEIRAMSNNAYQYLTIEE